MTEYEIITYVKSLEVVFDSKIEAKKYLELIRELDSESVHVLSPIEDTELLCHSDAVSNATEISKEEFMDAYDELVVDVKNGFYVDSSGKNAPIDIDSPTLTTLRDSTQTKQYATDVPVIDCTGPYSNNQCPECKSELQHTGGCVPCICGYTRGD